MKEIKDFLPVELIQPLTVESEQFMLQAAPATCDVGTIVASCQPKGIIR